MEIEWKVYDRAAQRIVIEATTGGAAKVESMSKDGRFVSQEAFAAAVRNLLASQELANLVGR